MISYVLRREEIIYIVEQFHALGLAPTSSKAAIISAFRKLAASWHPDKAQSPEQRNRFEEKFKQLVGSRDELLQCIQIADLLGQISRFEAMPSENVSSHVRTEPGYHRDRQTDNATAARVDDEWKQFVSDQAVYFSLIDSVGITISSAVALGFSTFFFGIILSIVIGLVIWGVVAIFSASVAIPFAGWIAGIFAVIWLLGKLGELIESVRKYTLASLSSTGYPLTTFVVGWVSINLLLLLTTYWIGGWVFLPLVVQNLGYGLLYLAVSDALNAMQAAMERIRNATNTHLVISQARKRYSSATESAPDGQTGWRAAPENGIVEQVTAMGVEIQKYASIFLNDHLPRLRAVLHALLRRTRAIGHRILVQLRPTLLKLQDPIHHQQLIHLIRKKKMHVLGTTAAIFVVCMSLFAYPYARVYLAARSLDAVDPSEFEKLMVLLRSYPAESSRELLRLMRTGTSGIMRGNAGLALVRIPIRTENVGDQLLDMLSDPDRTARKSALQALTEGGFTDRSHIIHKVLPIIVNPDEDLREAAAAFLLRCDVRGFKKTPDLERNISAALNDPNPSVKTFGTRVSNYWGPIDLDPSPDHRFIIEAYYRLSSLPHSFTGNRHASDDIAEHALSSLHSSEPNAERIASMQFEQSAYVDPSNPRPYILLAGTASAIRLPRLGISFVRLALEANSDQETWDQIMQDRRISSLRAEAAFLDLTDEFAKKK